MSLILNYLKGRFFYVFLCFLGSVGAMVSMLGIPTLLGLLIDEAIIPGDQSLLIRIFALMVLFAGFGFLGRLLSSYAAAKVTSEMTEEIRNDAYQNMMTFSHKEYREFGVASLTNRITTDAFIILQFTEQILRAGMTTPLMIIASLALMVSTQPRLSVVLIPAVLVMVLVSVIISRQAGPLSKAQQGHLDTINGLLRENINGVRVIRSFNQEDYREALFAGAADAFRRVTRRLFNFINIAPPAFTFALNLMTLGILFLGSIFISRGEMELGTLTTFLSYTFHVLYSLILLVQILIMYPRTSVSAHRLQEVIQKESSIDPNLDGAHEGDGSGLLEFKGVYFQYPDAEEAILKDISFQAKKGQTIAFIGSTGSGKSTIINLIPRLFDVTGGQILYEGLDIRDYNIHSLREKIGFSPQKALLFTGSIQENLKFGKNDANFEDLERAASISQAEEFISRLENRYDTVLSEGGTNLSGGQKQRLAIARTIIDQPDIYIFDDSFSALDYQTDARVRQLLSEETQDALTIIVAQRVSSIIQADLILVIDEGQIVAQGTHQDLLDKSDLYREIAESQLDKEEMAQ